MPAASDDGTSGNRKVTTPVASGDPAGVPAKGRSLREEEERQFHATHFTADPRGAAMSGAPPGGGRRRNKKRGGTPPDAQGKENTPPPRPKRRGGAGPE